MGNRQGLIALQIFQTLPVKSNMVGQIFNILTNLFDLKSRITVLNTDRLIGILPPFHSFGLLGVVALPVCGNVQTVYHPNPTEGAALARIIDAYKVNILLGTPTFLNGMIHVAEAEQLKTLRFAVTGAEKCP